MDRKSISANFVKENTITKEEVTYVNAKVINEALGLSSDNIIYYETCDSCYFYVIQVEDKDNDEIYYLEELIEDCDEVYSTSYDSDEYILVKKI